MPYYYIFMWGIFPYLVMVLTVVGVVWRYRKSKYFIHSPSTELLEKRYLSWAGPFFHYGLLFVFLGHVVGVVIPANMLASVGITTHIHDILAFYAGLTAGIVMLIGLLGLIYRRIHFKILGKTLQWDYVLIYIMLVLATVLGLSSTINDEVIVHFNYNATVGPWFDSLWILRPDLSAMATVPLLLQIHIMFGMLFIAAFSYTIIIHSITGTKDAIRFYARPRLAYRKLTGFTEMDNKLTKRNK